MQHFTEGWTTPIEYQLKKNGAAFNATGMTVETILTDKDKVEITEVGSTAWSDAANSIVKYSPAASDLTAARSPMGIRWKVTDGAGKIAFFPQGEPEELVVHRP
jgi:hypothetical protein